MGKRKHQHAYLAKICDFQLHAQYKHIYEKNEIDGGKEDVIRPEPQKQRKPEIKQKLGK